MKRTKRVASHVVVLLLAALLAVLPGSVGAGAVGAGSTGGAARAATPSGTIVFVKNHNVWLVRPDGSGAVQVTRDGSYATPYMSPSMSNAGIIAVGHGHTVVRMRQNGQVLNRIDPHPLTNSAGQPTDGPPVHVSISPDGSRIAYTMVNYGCPVGVSCGPRSVTGVTDASALSPNRLGSNYYTEPSWVGNSRLMTHGGYGSNMMLQDLGGSAAQHWYDDEDVLGDSSEDLGDGEISADGNRLAVVRGYGSGTHLLTAVVNGDPRTAAPGSLPDPTYGCYTNTDEHINSPSWGPGNTSLVLGDSDGLVIMTVGATCDDTTFRAIAPGGSEPSWSPAALNTSSPRFVLKTKPKVTGRAVVGRKVTATAGVWTPSPTTVGYRWLRNGKAIAGKAGAQRSYRVRAADRRKRLSVKVTVSRSGYANAVAQSAAVVPGGRTLVLKAKPKITGKAVVGRTLKATAGAWSPQPAAVRYQWLRNGKAIKGKAGKQRSYRVRAADRRKRLSVKVTVSRSGFPKAVARSKAVRVRR